MNARVKRPKQFGVLVPPDPDWLALHQPEEILLPDLEIVDAHHHLWDTPGLASPGFRYLLPDFVQDLGSGHKVIATVYADCMSMYRADGPQHLRPVGETEFAVEIGAMSRSGQYGPTQVNAGIVAYADLELGSPVEEVLEAHIQAGNGRFKGIRYAANWDPDPGILHYQPNRRADLLKDRKVRDGLHKLKDLGLVYDSWTFFTQLDQLAEVADAEPDLQIVMNHCGGPLGYGPYADNKAEHFAAWKTSVLNVARRPNVACKLGGILGRGAAYDFINAPIPPTSLELAVCWRPWFETCIEAFGPERCMFESNYPVEKLGTSYSVLWNAFKRIAAYTSDEEIKQLFATTARRIYTLDI